MATPTNCPYCGSTQFTEINPGEDEWQCDECTGFFGPVDKED